MPNWPNSLFTRWTVPAWIVLVLEAIHAIRKLFGLWSEGEFLYDKQNVVIDFLLSPLGQLIVMAACVGFLFYSSRKHDTQASGTPVGTIRLADAVVRAFNETQTLPIAHIAERAVGRNNVLLYYANYLAEGSKLFGVRAPATEHDEILDVALALAQSSFEDDGDTLMSLGTRKAYRDLRIRKKDFSRNLDKMKRETDSEPVRASRQYSIEEFKDIKGVLQEKAAAQLSLHASHQCDVSTSSSTCIDLVNLSVDISPGTPFWLTCNVHKEQRKRIWCGLKLNDICVNRVDGEHVMEDDANVHIKWLIGPIDRKQIRQVVMEYPRESIHGEFGTEGKAAESIRKISIYGRNDDGVMTLRKVYVFTP